jgi:hypothetical protein
MAPLMRCAKVIVFGHSEGGAEWVASRPPAAVPQVFVGHHTVEASPQAAPQATVRPLASPTTAPMVTTRNAPLGRFMFLSFCFGFRSSSSLLSNSLINAHVPHKSVKDVKLAVKAGSVAASAPPPLALGGAAPPAIAAIVPSVVGADLPAPSSPPPPVALKLARVLTLDAVPSIHCPLQPLRGRL